MHWLTFASYFFGGAFLCNAIPHFVSGVTGRAFQSPFAHPPGKGLSSALVNVGVRSRLFLDGNHIGSRVRAVAWRRSQGHI
jgi:hypothetical protein